MSSSRRSFITKTAMAAALAPFASLTKTYGQPLEDAIERTSKASAPSDLRITDVKCAYSGGGLFVKIMTNQDIVGWGEAVDAIGGTYYMVNRMGRQLVGRSPLTPNAIFHQFRSNPFGGVQAGMAVAVMSAFDAALWDLCGKALGVPVYQLLGGKFRDRVRVYCDTQLYSVRNPTPDVFAKVARTAIDKGYTAVKFDLDEANDPNRYDRVNWNV
jgi:galactonate dehydratase